MRKVSRRVILHNNKQTTLTTIAQGISVTRIVAYISASFDRRHLNPMNNTMLIRSTKWLQPHRKRVKRVKSVKRVRRLKRPTQTDVILTRYIFSLFDKLSSLSVQPAFKCEI